MDAESEQVEAYRTEIERLQVRIKVLVGMLADCASDKALITELCDALEYPSEVRAVDLFQRAREATR